MRQRLEPAAANLTNMRRLRDLEKILVKLPNGTALNLPVDEPNLLNKAVIEEFLPRFGKESSVLFIGNMMGKPKYMDEAELDRLGLFELYNDEFPEIVAYNEKDRRMFLIESSTNIVNELRMLQLRKLLKDCPAELIFVTAFLNRTEFKKWAADIAWESEVWIADNPDHMIHFNGHKFLGAY